MKRKIIDAFLNWCETYEVEDFRINSFSKENGGSDIDFYIYEAEIPLRVNIETRTIEFIFGGEDDPCSGRTLDDGIIFEFADLCNELRKILGSYNF